ncbi:MAG TPA: NADH-quinone oxidoreductase subunit NuoG [Casimicrobiaceae bacterium]|nr:NADH-quinone oxidoreductase subunit NuoG [Casimicrobiaceae bacterium]
MLTLEVDGKSVQVPNGSTVMDAAHKLDIYVPHFCWHKKLTIAANCRMCLVQVEKAPKPQPACATPAAEGMKVWTHSEAAVTAQKGVMEFLLINHPLDCPICDQGGECQLQDLAVGYGASSSRYDEPKRVVLNKNLGPLIATDMTRCIHCTRCVRFGQEIAGVMELGMTNRGEFAEIMTFVGRTVDSELSGNMIDLCPVGALTSKPFRYTARTWELARRKSVSPHDGLGSNLIVQVKNDRVMRVVPLENEPINECWLSDKDRFSYEGLNSQDRLTRPLLRRDGRLVESDWQTALEYAAAELVRVRDQYGADAVGALVSPHSTLEELHLAQKLIRGLGSDNIDFRLRQSDFSVDTPPAGAPWLGMSIAEFAALDRILIVGSFLRNDHPLLAHRLRQAAKKGAQLSLVHASDDDLSIRVARKAIVAPSAMPRVLAEIVVAAAAGAGKPAPAALSGITASADAQAIAASLASGERKGIFLGNFAQHHPNAAQLHALAQELARLTGATQGFLTEAANSVGGHIAGAMPQRGGMNANAMLVSPRKAYLLLHTETDLDAADPGVARAALKAAECVIALSPFRSGVAEHADVVLPISPFSETAGTFVNCEGRVQAFNGVAPPLGEARPAWKVLRVLGSLLGLAGFAQDSIEAVRLELPAAEAIAAGLSNATGTAIGAPASTDAVPERVADVPMYFADPLVRRAASLQKTRNARPPAVRASAATLARLQLADGDAARVRRGEGEAMLKVVADPSVPDGCVRIAAAHPTTSMLGPMFGSIVVEAVL